MNNRPKVELVSCGLTLTLGSIPRVVGTLSSPEWQLALADGSYAPDIVEVRLDLMGIPPRWMKRCRAIEFHGRPVLLTLRSASEGGKWDRGEKTRSHLLARALDSVSAVDIELNSEIADEVSRHTRQRGKICVVSFHDFNGTPPLAELESIVKRAQKIGSIAKVSTFIRARRDLDTLRALLRRNWKVPLCVIGMGPLATDSRVTFPTLGSCLTYGYLDMPAAPGQLPVAKLLWSLRDVMSAYNLDYLARRRAFAASQSRK